MKIIYLEILKCNLFSINGNHPLVFKSLLKKHQFYWADTESFTYLQ